MPELPEVETTCRGIRPFIEKQTIQQVVIRQTRLRWPVPQADLLRLAGSSVLQVKRRGKYILLMAEFGSLILHLGMSGRLQILTTATAADKHDHIDILFHNQCLLRFTDPRRFGACLWTSEVPLAHPLLKDLGIEPLTRQFTAHYLYRKLQQKKRAIKAVLMDQRIVVGVGNIYATEALFAAGIHPAAAAHTLTLARLKKLVSAVKSILRRAICQGGTTLRDFFNSQGKPGYFSQQLQVYGRGALPCPRCAILLQVLSTGHRRTVFCQQCQI
jgi:formamidopyrimidine-DNA glycosylase